MNESEVKRLNRRELLEMLVVQSRKIDILVQRVNELEDQLAEEKEKGEMLEKMEGDIGRILAIVEANHEG
jgi:predicted RNase H-like nuclease (RuvC/YqgF family)